MEYDSRLNGEVTHANGLDLARFEEVFHFRPGFVDGCTVKLYFIRISQRNIFPDGVYITTVSKVHHEVDTPMAALESANAAGPWIRY